MEPQVQCRDSSGKGTSTAPPLHDMRQSDNAEKASGSASIAVAGAHAASTPSVSHATSAGATLGANGPLLLRGLLPTGLRGGSSLACCRQKVEYQVADEVVAAAAWEWRMLNSLAILTWPMAILRNGVSAGPRAPFAERAK